VGEDQRGAVHCFDDFGHGESFAGTSDTEEDLVLFAGIDAAHDLVDGGGLVASRLIVAAQLEFHERSLLPA
jgi:hypothetical protein